MPARGVRNGESCDPDWGREAEKSLLGVTGNEGNICVRSADVMGRLCELREGVRRMSVLSLSASSDEVLRLRLVEGGGGSRWDL